MTDLEWADTLDEYAEHAMRCWFVDRQIASVCRESARRLRRAHSAPTDTRHALVGIAEIAERSGERRHIVTWAHRTGQLGTPWLVLKMGPIYDWPTVRDALKQRRR